MFIIPVPMLVIFSVFAMNLVLQNALGIKEFVFSGDAGIKRTAAKLLIIFITINILWVFFARVLPLFFSGIFCYVLLFPVSIIVYNVFEYLIFTKLLKFYINEDASVNFTTGITGAALFICLNISNTFLEAFFLSFGFTAGTFLVYLILTEIGRRASLETVPRYFRGKPLIIISMGLLSVVFSTASLLIFRMLGS
jgi:electron transport complex protein RnfA